MHKRGISVPQQRQIIREQARLYFKLSHAEQQLAEEEEAEVRDAELEAETVENNIVANNINVVVKESNVVVDNNVVVNTKNNDKV